MLESKRLPANTNKEILKADPAGYNRGDHRGIDRIKP